MVLSFVIKSLHNNHEITVLVRNKQKIKVFDEKLKIVEGDIYDKDVFEKLTNIQFDSIVNVIGATL